jgi:hypothetical protein
VPAEANTALAGLWLPMLMLTSTCVLQVVRWQRAKKRQGTHKTKDRSEVSGMHLQRLSYHTIL